MNHKDVHDALFAPLLYIYGWIQWVLSSIFTPDPPSPTSKLDHGEIAVIGAGLTGVSAASHCVGHGFDVALFEKGDRDAIGGIWAKVNNTSGLQISSIMYRFQPSVKWSGTYPKRSEIVGQVEGIWKRYGLEEKTHFNTKVHNVYKDDQGRWIVNDPSYGRFDGILAAVGTCGDPKMPSFNGRENFKGEIFHSSQLDGKSVEGKKVAIIGGGASAVEALEFVDQGNALETNVLARSEKWIIPRNAIIDMLLALNVFGQETIFSWIPENLLRVFFYRDLQDIAPPKDSSKGIFTETPMVNSRILELIRSGRAHWLRGDILGLEENGVRFNTRAQGVPKNGPGHEKLVEADTIILATGFTRPSLSFLPEKFFQDPYQPPNWFAQTFPPWDPSVCANNCTFVQGIGSVGNWHIGIYTRFLLMFLADPLATPTEKWMKRWIDMTKALKKSAPGGQFEFFTYAELIYWFLFLIVINPFRWKWGVFVLFGIGAQVPAAIVGRENKLREMGKAGNIKTNGV